MGQPGQVSLTDQGGLRCPSVQQQAGRYTVGLARGSQQGELLITVRQDRGVGGKGEKVEKDREKEKGGRADRKKEK